jgi:hypothetical protein
MLLLPLEIRLLLTLIKRTAFFLLFVEPMESFLNLSYFCYTITVFLDRLRQFNQHTTVCIQLTDVTLTVTFFSLLASVEQLLRFVPSSLFLFPWNFQPVSLLLITLILTNANLLP